MLIKLPPERMPIAKIESLFPNHWILIDKPETDEQHRVQSGMIVFAHPSLDVVNQKCAELQLQRFAVWYTRKSDPNVRYLL